MDAARIYATVAVRTRMLQEEAGRMGGLLQECGCFDGPFSAENPQLISRRCAEHADVPAAEGCTLLVSRRERERAEIVADRIRAQGRMTIPKTRRRKRR